MKTIKLHWIVKLFAVYSPRYATEGKRGFKNPVKNHFDNPVQDTKLAMCYYIQIYPRYRVKTLKKWEEKLKGLKHLYVLYVTNLYVTIRLLNVHL